MNYDLVFDDLTSNTIAPGDTQTFFGQATAATATWDENLAMAGIQIEAQLLNPGFQYGFKRV